MVLDHNNYSFKSSLFQNPNPLIRIQFRRTKKTRIFLTISPFPLIKGIDAKMNESRQLISMISQLGC